MAKCELNPNIKMLSGKIGGTLFKTFKRRDGSVMQRAYILPRMKNGKYGYERKAPLSKNEILARAKFTRASTYLNSLSDESKQRFAKEWKEAKYMFNGKKYVTLRGYIMARIFADMKEGINID